MIETYISLAITWFILVASPGPNNIILLTAGANYGIKQALPVTLGITAGVSIMIALANLGAINFLSPTILSAMGFASMGVILYLAYKTLHSRPASIEDKGSAPTFLQMFAFQSFNPKAWAMTAAIAIAYPISLTTLLSIVIPMTIFCNLCWAAAGGALRDLLTNNDKFRLCFNATMAATMVLSVAYAIFS